MNKSQLRLLAREKADGRIPLGEYRVRRRELIDNIVAGTEAIERAQPPQQPHDSGEDETTTLNDRGERVASQRSPTTRSRLPSPLPLATGAVLCVGIVAALLWPEPEQPAAKLTAPAIPLTKEISRSRALVESFVARRDFGTDATDDFRRDWRKIDSTEREQARNELWFGSLVRALRDEIKTQKALAGLGAGEAALNRVQKAFALGEFLGVSDKLPDIENITMPSATPASGPTPTTPAGAGLPSTPAATANAQPTGRQWLAAQADEQLTLQIFAVNKLDRVEQLIAAHPKLVVHVLATEGAAPRYRIYHGVFADEARARQAFAALPAKITGASHGAIVKSFSVVRSDLRAQAATSSAPTRTPAGAFTLQVFATGNRDSAQALVRAFPALKLQLREIPGDPAPYRVVHGDYSSADEARAAASALPQDLLARIGTPLPKSISSLARP